MRQLKIGLQGLRSSERTSFLKKLFEHFDNVQKWFRRIAGCSTVERRVCEGNGCELVNRLCICENGMQVVAWVEPTELGLQV